MKYDPVEIEERVVLARLDSLPADPLMGVSVIREKEDPSWSRRQEESLRRKRDAVEK